MIFFEKVIANLKHKWLLYFQTHHIWLSKGKATWVKTSDGGYRPSSDLILGAINALEPRLSELMVPFCELNNDSDKLVQVLGLDFDPDKELSLLNSNGDKDNNHLSHKDTVVLNDSEGLNNEASDALTKLKNFNELKKKQALVKVKELESTLKN